MKKLTLPLWWTLGRLLDVRNRWRARGRHSLYPAPWHRALLGPLTWGPYACPCCRRAVMHDNFTCEKSGTYPTEWGTGHFAVGTMTCPRCGWTFDWEESSP